MASHPNSSDEDLTLASRSSQLSSDEVNEQIARLPPEGLTSANHTHRPRTTSEEKDDVALALRSSPLPSDHFNEQVARLHRTGSASASEEARPSTPPNESDKDGLKPEADIIDEQARWPNQWRGSRTNAEGSLASLPVEVRTTLSLYLNKPLKILPG
jgi:hypothetical protein